MTNNPTDLKAALRKACEEAAIECHPSNTLSRAVLTATEVARIFERRLTPVFEALRSVIEHDPEAHYESDVVYITCQCGWDARDAQDDNSGKALWKQHLIRALKGAPR